MNTKESLDYLVESLIDFNLEQKNFANIISSAKLTQLTLPPLTWRAIIEQLPWQEIADELKKHKKYANDLQRYLKQNHCITAALFFKKELKLNFNLHDINRMVQYHIRMADQKAAEEIFSASLYYREKNYGISKNWLCASKIIAVNCGQVNLFLKMTDYLPPIDSRDLYIMLAQQINKLKERYQDTKKEIRECKLCSQLLNLLPPEEKAFYQKLIFEKQSG